MSDPWKSARPAGAAGWRLRLAERGTPSFVLVLLVGAFLLPPPAALSVAVPATLAWVAFCGGSALAWVRAVIGFAAFLLVGCLPMFLDISWVPLRASIDAEGVRHARNLASRSLSAFLALRTLSLVLPPARLLQLPLRVPLPQGLRELLQLCAISAFALGDTASRLARAWRARAPRLSLANRRRGVEHLAARLVPHALDEAERRERAWRARGWSGGPLRTHAMRGGGR